MNNNCWSGVFAATLCPFREDYSIDEGGLRSYFSWLASVPGMKGLVCNGHTGEIMSLRARERAEVCRILSESVQGQAIKKVSGINCEGSFEAIDHALEAKANGMDAILLMPPHHWLRFGRSFETAVGFIQDVAQGANIPIIIHQYPAWTKAGYTLAEMLEMVKIPQVVCIKMGTRDMTRLRFDYERLKEAAPHIPIISCHDEYLLASLLEGADGALVGFAGFAPDLIIEMVSAALEGNLQRARAAQKKVELFSRIIYRFGEPSSNAHHRMKTALRLQGKFSSDIARPPLRALPADEKEDIRQKLLEAGVPLPSHSD